MKYVFPFVLTCSALLTACGGGGGGSSDSSSTVQSAAVDPIAEGAYSGTATGGASSAFQMLVLEDGSYWTIYGTSSGSAFYVDGFVQGSGTFKNGTMSSSNAKDFGDSPATPGTISATYTSTPSIAGTFAVAGGTVSFGGGVIANSTYNYKTPALLSSISGAWNATLLTGETVALNISNTGAIGGVSSWGCSYSGTVTPRASGKNVFDVSLHFGASPCALPNQTASGIAVTYALSNGKSQIIFAATDATRTYGSAGFATR